jgi:MoaA/NifB/PqqE/SkfB family radical SAM enzyme
LIKGFNKFKRSLQLGSGLLRGKSCLASISLFVTDRCNSQCLICNIWKKKPKTDLDPDIVKAVLESKVLLKSCNFILAGGEFILHPEFDKILSLLNESKRDYTLLSNGLMADKLVEVVREFEVKRLTLSLDGSEQTYEQVRGVDGYSRVEKVVDELSGEDVHIGVGFTVNPWNSRLDLLHVMDFCRRKAVDLHVGYYCGMEYYGVSKSAGELYLVGDLVHHPYHRLYPVWASGNLEMPCLSILLRTVIRPNGDVELCEPSQIRLGNLYEENLEEIWRSHETRLLHKNKFSCNGCWHDTQRLCDFQALSSLKLVPDTLLNRVFGKSDWNKIFKLLGESETGKADANAEMI